ncbi:MAG: MBL fold metallo-hydrolase [Calditrichota bacterium]
MKIGAYQINLIDSGRFRLDGGAMFGVVPRVLWERKMPPDDKNRIHMGANLLFIRSADRKILVDTGMGNKGDEKFLKINAVDHSEHSLEKGLSDLELKPEDITDVILTHLHYDHAGGATYLNNDGELKPTFVNARYYVQRDHFGWAMKPTEKDRASFLKENFIPLQESNQLILVDGETELFPGIRLLPVNGHTTAQQMVQIYSDDVTLLFAGDLLPTSRHVSLPWVMAYDIAPLKTLEEKKHYLHLAADQEWLVVFEHDPEVQCTTIEKTEKGYAPGKIVDINSL